MSKRVNIYIRDITYQLLVEYCEQNEFDKSRAVDDLLSGRLAYLKEAKQKAIKELNKEEYKLIKTYNIPKGNEKIFLNWYSKNNYDEKIAKGEIGTAEILINWTYAEENPTAPKSTIK